MNRHRPSSRFVWSQLGPILAAILLIALGCLSLYHTSTQNRPECQGTEVKAHCVD